MPTPNTINPTDVFVVGVLWAIAAHRPKIIVILMEVWAARRWPFSGKVDQGTAQLSMCRYIAKNIVAADLAIV